MITIIILILSLVMNLGTKQEAAPVVIIPAMPQYYPTQHLTQPYFHGDDCLCDACCYKQAYIEYSVDFTELFNSYETKRAKNGALMIRRGNSGSYRFAKKG